MLHGVPAFARHRIEKPIGGLTELCFPALECQDSSVRRIQGALRQKIDRARCDSVAHHGRDAQWIGAEPSLSQVGRTLGVTARMARLLSLRETGADSKLPSHARNGAARTELPCLLH